MPVLRVGDSGPEVVEVKRLLARSGLWSRVRLSPNFTPTLEKAVVYFQQTHLNRHGKPCGVDGMVGPETMWALRHPSGRAQRSYLPADRIPARIGDARTELLEIALGQHGIKEIPDGSNRSTRPKGGIDKYLPAWAKKEDGKGAPWCCFFVSWVTKQAFGTYPLGRREGACRLARERAIERRMWRPKARYAPVPGDAFVMLYRKNGEWTGAGHIGFVHRVSRDGQAFNTVEGNCGNRVKLGRRSLDEASLEGFIDFWKDGRDRQDFARGLSRAKSVAREGTR